MVVVVLVGSGNVVVGGGGGGGTKCLGLLQCQLRCHNYSCARVFVYKVKFIRKSVRVSVGDLRLIF